MKFKTLVLAVAFFFATSVNAELATEANSINSKTTSGAELNFADAKDAIQQLLPAGFSVYTWQDLNRSQFYSFQTSKNLLMFIMFLILLAASVNVSSAMVMLIMERRKEIAILKATGAHPFFITMSFLIAGMCTGAAGLCIGLTGGILAALHINELFTFFEYALNTGQTAFY